jgi:hypothetical protein
MGPPSSLSAHIPLSVKAPNTIIRVSAMSRMGYLPRESGRVLITVQHDNRTKRARNFLLSQLSAEITHTRSHVNPENERLERSLPLLKQALSSAWVLAALRPLALTATDVLYARLHSPLVRLRNFERSAVQ